MLVVMGDRASALLARQARDSLNCTVDVGVVGLEVVEKTPAERCDPILADGQPARFDAPWRVRACAIDQPVSIRRTAGTGRQCWQRENLMKDEGKRIDLNEVERLVEALERDLERARRGEADIGELRGEVEQLRATLAADQVAHADVHRGLLGVRDRLHALGDELFDDAVKAGDYIARLGRLLGM